MSDGATLKAMPLTLVVFSPHFFEGNGLELPRLFWQ
jgi:hypothetical protein